jgi:peptide/nickel transport system substrate-binding protein
LAALVASGKLPPIEERLPAQSDLLVIETVEGIGEYGGVWRRGFTGPADKWNGYRCCTGPDHVMFWDYTGNIPGPNVAKDLHISDDGTEFTIHLRKGMKWSDGVDVTADDWLFWFEDMYSNEELVPTKGSWSSIGGVQGTFEKIDDYTIKWTFASPYWFFPSVLAGATDIGGGQAYRGLIGKGSFAPKHYLSQYIPHLSGADAVDKIVADEGYDSWVNLIKFKNDWALNPELPVLTPWKTVQPINNDIWRLERNPYYYGVDLEGNQLPYIDTVVLTMAEDLEVMNLRAIAGDYDWQARHLNMAKVPLYIENQEKGGYQLYFDTQEVGSDVILSVNLSYALDDYVAGLLQDVNFRRAVALGFKRDQLNEVFWLGLGVPGSHAPSPTNMYSPGPESEWRSKWATFDPDTANQWLDELGLDKKDADGYRLRADNGERLVLEIMGRTAQFMEFVGMAEMICEHWAEYISIQCTVNAVERSLAGTIEAADEFMFQTRWGDGSDHMFTFPHHVFPTGTSSGFGSQIGTYYATAGEKGTEPHAEMKQVMDLFRKGFGVPDAERIELGKEVWRITLDQAWGIGLVGQSPASLGVRVAKTDLGNVPSRQYNNPDTKTPGISRPMTLYWKSEANRAPQPLSYEE